MFFRRLQNQDLLPELLPAQRALAEGRYEAALVLLERAMRRQRGSAQQAQLLLHLAAAYALYGARGLEWGSKKLSEALKMDALCAQSPLYQGLYWEFAAYRGEAAALVRHGVKRVFVAQEPVATYHGASALFVIADFREVVRVLRTLNVDDLPKHLRWRYWSLLGKSLDALDDVEEAAAAFEKSVALSVDQDQQHERLNLAAKLLELEHPARALRILHAVEPTDLDNNEQLLLCHIEGRSQLTLGNPNLALEYLQRACDLEAQRGEASYMHTLALAQCLAALGRFAEAIHHYQSALKLAPTAQRIWTTHEYALLLAEAEELNHARELLLDIHKAKDYMYHPEVAADLAEVEFKLNHFKASASYAEMALEQGVVISPCLTLGSIAYEYYHFDDAITWFEKALAASHHGSAEWLHAQQMLADIFVQQGYLYPQQVIVHAEAALAYMHPRDEWSLILHDYVRTAKRILGGHKRNIN